MSKPTNKRTVVVTGASTGIGRACAIRLQKAGMHVFAGVRRQEDADALSKLAEDRLTPIFLDVTDSGSIETSVKTVTSEMAPDGLFGLVNNAGVGIAGPLEFIDPEALRRQLEVNVVGQIVVTRAFMPLIRRHQGRIVNIGSIRGRLAVPLSGPYSASKFAMEGLTDVLRQELKPWGIHVSLVQPGTIDTGIHEKADKLLTRLPAEAEQMYRPLIDAVRGTKEKKVRAAIPPEQVAEVVMRALTAVCPRSRYLVGTDAKVHALLASLLPDKLRDVVVSRFLGIPSSLD